MTLAKRQRTAATRLNYPPGTLLELISMGNDPFPVPPGTCGTVLGVDDAGQVLMHWDNGRSLSLIPGEDAFRKLTQEEISEEQSAGGMECQTM